MAGGQVWIPVNASMRGFATTVAQEAAKAAGAGGKTLETEFGKAGARSGQAVADGLAAAAGKVDAASRALATARNAETTAANDAAVAETKLNQLRDSGNYTMGQLAKAESALEVAKLKAATAAERVASREADLASVRDGGQAKSAQLVRAEDQLTAARVKHVDAAGKAKAAEADLEDAQQDAATALERVEDATEALTAARAKYGAESKEAAAAEKDLARAQKDSDKATLDVVKAQGKARTAATDLANATDDARSKSSLLEGVQRDLADAERAAGAEADDAGKKIRGMGDDMSGAEGKSLGLADGLVGVLKNAALAGAGIAGIGEAISTGMNVTGAIDDMNLQLGLTGDTAAMFGEDVKEVMRGGIAGGVEDATAAIGALNSEFRHLGSEGEQTAVALSDNFLAFSDMFGVEMSEATSLAGSLITNGLAPDVETAADLMTEAFRRVPVAMRDELPEVMTEYGTYFSSMGMSGQDAFGLIVNAAELGKIGMDKVGDAVKEFGIKATDLGDTGAVEALDALGLAGEDIQNRLLAGGDTAKAAFEQVVGGLADVPDAAKQAELAVDLFGTPLEDLDKAKIPAFLDGLTGAGDAMAGFEGSSQAAADTIANSLSGRLDALKGTAASLASDGFMWLWDVTQNKIVPALKDAGDWIQRNRTWLEPLAAVAGGVAAAMGGLAAAHAVQSMWASRAAFSTTALGKAFGLLMAHPIVALIAGVAAGLVYFFTQTETGREMWDKFTAALAVGWDWVVEKLSAGWAWIRDNALTPLMNFATGTVLPILSSVWSGIQSGWDVLVGAFQWGYDNIFRPVFDGLMTVGKVVAAVLMTAVLAPILVAWNLLRDGIQWGWENIIKPAWDALAAAGSWLWNSVLMPVFDAIKSGWSLLADGVKWYWENVIMVAWSALQTAASWMWDNVLSPIFGFIGDMWKTTSDGILWAWENIIKPAWDALSTALTWLYDNTVKPVFQWIGDRWDDMSAVLFAGYEWVKDKVFGGLSSALDVLKDAFRKGVDGIKELWHGIRRATAEPVEFVIKVFNEGVVAAWNKVAGWVDLPTVEEYKPDWLGSYAEGTSRVPGARTPYDNVHMMTPDGKFGLSLRGGEGVVVPEVVDALGPHRIDAMNAAAKTGGRKGVERYLGGFAGGGVIGSITSLVNRFFPGMTITSTLRPGDPGHHGAGQAVDFSDGYDTTPGMQAAARFFHDKYGAGLAELIHYPLNGWVNIKNGSPLDYGPATNSEHRNHVHIASRVPLPDPEGDLSSYLEQAAASGSSGGGFSMSGMVKSAWDAIVGKLPKWEGGGTIGQLPGAFLKGAAGMAWDFVKTKIPFLGGGGGGGDVEQWRDLARSALSRHGYNPDDHIEAMLEQIRIESSGDPSAMNYWDSNAANGDPSGGLLQVIGATYRDVRRRYPEAFEGLPDDRMNPATNLVAGVGAVRRDWGGPAGRWPTTGGYDNGGWLNPGATLVQNDTGKPEPVFNPAQWAVLRDGLSAVADLADPLQAWVDRGIGELERMANAAEAGFNAWASGEADGKTRMGTPGEWGAHFGGMALESTADDLLGLVGMGGFVGGKLNGHTVGLLNAIGATFGLGSTSGDVLSAPRLLDDDGRVLQASTATVAAPAPTPSPESLTATPATGAAGGGGGGGSTTVIELEGGRVYAAEDLEQLNGKVDGLEVRVKKVEDDQTAPTTSTLSFL